MVVLGGKRAAERQRLAGCGGRDLSSTSDPPGRSVSMYGNCWVRNKDLYISDFENGFRIRPKYQNIEGSLSASSKPIFAAKYSFCSILRDLRNLHTFAPLQTHFFRKKHVQLFFQNFPFFDQKIDEILAGFWVCRRPLTQTRTENDRTI